MYVCVCEPIPIMIPVNTVLVLYVSNEQKTSTQTPLDMYFVGNVYCPPSLKKIVRSRVVVMVMDIMLYSVAMHEKKTRQHQHGGDSVQ